MTHDNREIPGGKPAKKPGFFGKSLLMMGGFALLCGLFGHGMIAVFSEEPAVLAVGVLGGFTTFSSFALDVATLWERGDVMASGAYIAGSTALSILALFTGLWAVRQVLA